MKTAKTEGGTAAAVDTATRRRPRQRRHLEMPAPAATRAKTTMMPLLREGGPHHRPRSSALFPTQNWRSSALRLICS